MIPSSMLGIQSMTGSIPLFVGSGFHFNYKA
jgi:hypothetical protein